MLPLMEETDGHEEELFSMDDIKLEVMRARGAGGQVIRQVNLLISYLLTLHPKARQQNRISRPAHPYTHRNNCIYARRKKSTSSA